MPARVLLQGISPEDLAILQGLNLLTSHPVLYVCNVAEADGQARWYHDARSLPSRRDGGAKDRYGAARAGQRQRTTL